MSNTSQLVTLLRSELSAVDATREKLVAALEALAPAPVVMSAPPVSMPVVKTVPIKPARKFWSPAVAEKFRNRDITIRAMWVNGDVTQKKIGEQFGISDKRVAQIVSTGPSEPAHFARERKNALEALRTALPPDACRCPPCMEEHQRAYNQNPLLLFKHATA